MNKIINFLRRLGRVLLSPSRFKLAIKARMPRLRRLVISQLPEAISQPIQQIESEQAELRLNQLKRESQEYLHRIGCIEPLSDVPELSNKEQS
jgi:hypothetical protein